MTHAQFREFLIKSQTETNVGEVIGTLRWVLSEFDKLPGVAAKLDKWIINEYQELEAEKRTFATGNPRDCDIRTELNYLRKLRAKLKELSK